MRPKSLHDLLDTFYVTHVQFPMSALTLSLGARRLWRVSRSAGLGLMLHEACDDLCNAQLAEEMVDRIFQLFRKT